MALNNIKHSGSLTLKPQTAAPGSPENGLMYYSSTLNKFQFYQSGSFISISDAVTSGLTASRVVVTDAGNALSSSNVTTTELGHLSGTTSAVQTQLNAKIPSSEKGVANGVATLAANGKVPSNQLPAIALTDVHVVANETEQLALVNQEEGDVAIRSDENKSYIHLGSSNGNMTDWRELTVPSGAVTTVNGLTGTVVLTTDTVDEGSSNPYFTDARAKTAAVINTLGGSQTDQAPSVASVNTALGAKLANVVEDTTPQLGGPLDVNGQVIQDASNNITIAPQSKILRAKQASVSSFIEEEYVHSITLSASQSNVNISELSFDKTAYVMMECVFVLKEATTNNTRGGTLRVITDGSVASIADLSLEAGGDTGIVFSAAVNSNTIEVKYTSGANAATMRADIKRVKI